MGKKLFPGYRFGPDGQKKLFQSAEEVPEGWARRPEDVTAKSGGKKSAKAGDDDLKELRAEYTRVTGKKPGRKAADTLKEEISAQQAEWDQFFADAETTPAEVRELLSEYQVELPDENDIGALVVLAKEHLVEDDD